MTGRDVSLLASPTPGVQDRTPPVAPPPRKAKRVDTPTPVAPPVADSPVVLSSVEPVVQPATIAAAPATVTDVPDTTVRLSLHLDVDQLRWVHKQSEREDLWPGAFLESLLIEHSAAVVQAGVPRRRRRRNNVGRASCAMVISAEEHKRLVSASTSLGASKSAFVRNVIDLARNK